MANHKPEDFDYDEDDTLVDDEPEDGFSLLDDDEKPEDRRRDPLRKPV